MATKNDKLIEGLMKVVDERKKEIAKAEKPKWETNCFFNFSDKAMGSGFNIHTVQDPEVLATALAFLISFEKYLTESVQRLGVKKFEFKWLGHTVSEWELDFKTRVFQIQLSTKKKQLEEAEKTLNKHLSPEIIAEREIASVAAALNEE